MQRSFRSAAYKLVAASNTTGCGSGLVVTTSATGEVDSVVQNIPGKVVFADLNRSSFTTLPCWSNSTLPLHAYQESRDDTVNTMAVSSFTKSFVSPGSRKAPTGPGLRSAQLQPSRHSFVPSRQIVSRPDRQEKEQPCRAGAARLPPAPSPGWSAASSTAAAVDAAQAAVRHCRRTVRAKATLAAPQMPLGEGAMVGFRTRDAQGLAVLKAQKGNSWQATDHMGLEVWLSPEDMVLQLPGNGYTSEDCAAVHSAAAAASMPPVEPIWEELSRDGRPLYVEELAERVFGASNAPNQWLAFHFALQNKIFFKQVGRRPPCFQPRLPEAVRERLNGEDLAFSEQGRILGFASAFAAAAVLPPSDKPQRDSLLSSPHGDIVRALEAYALTRETDKERELAAKALIAVGCYAHPDLAAEVLHHMGALRPWQPLALLRSRIPKEFSAEALRTAEALSRADPDTDPDRSSRVDLRHQKVVTIDDEYTTEIDDGLSAERLPDGRWRLWVHIADPTRWVECGSLLDAEAAQRMATVYLPTGKLPMFPSTLADGCFSLRAGQDTYAMSIGVVLDDSGAIEDVRVTPSIVRPAFRLSYYEADDLLRMVSADEEPELVALHEAARQRAQYREENGAISFSVPDCKVHVEFHDGCLDRPDIQVGPDGMDDSPSNITVKEMMVMAGEAVAMFCSMNNIHVPFRQQAAPVLPDDEEMFALPPGPCRAVALRRRMTRSTISVGPPGRHAGLGLDGYVQFTSPIRRYGDLLAHWQVKAFLRGEAPPFQPRELAEIMARVGLQMQDIGKLDRDVRNHWLAAFFQQRMDQTWSGLLMAWSRQEAGQAQVLIESLGLEIVQPVTRPAMPGEVLRLRCTEADIVRGTFRLEEVGP
uniref:Exoribonuclease II n=1 Tax=Tetraselmis sp. GSL018 TaxID=582737 RepID=A0A061RI81_9CHLO